MELDKIIFLIASVYFWLLFGGIGHTLSCDLKKAFDYPLFRHFTAIISIFFLFVIIDKNDNGAYEIWKNTLYLYLFYVLLTKNKWYFSIPIIILVLIDQTLLSENKHLEKNVSEFTKNDNENSKNLNEKINTFKKYRLYLQYLVIALIIIGFIHYFIRQKMKFKNKFDFFRFIFDVKCKNTKLSMF